MILLTKQFQTLNTKIMFNKEQSKIFQKLALRYAYYMNGNDKLEFRDIYPSFVSARNMCDFFHFYNIYESILQNESGCTPDYVNLLGQTRIGLCAGFQYDIGEYLIWLQCLCQIYNIDTYQAIPSNYELYKKNLELRLMEVPDDKRADEATYFIFEKAIEFADKINYLLNEIRINKSFFNYDSDLIKTIYHFIDLANVSAEYMFSNIGAPTCLDCVLFTVYDGADDEALKPKDAYLIELVNELKRVR